MQFTCITCGMALYRPYTDKTGIEKIFAFSHSKTATSFNILLVLQIPRLRNIYIFRSQITSAYIYNQCRFLLLLMVWHYVCKRQYTDKNTNIEKMISMYLKLHLHTLYNQCSFLLLLMVWRYNINDSIPTKTLTLRTILCERAERAILEFVCIFTF